MNKTALEMVDKLTLSNQQFLFLLDVASLINFCNVKGIKLTGGELYRTEYQQKEYFRTGKSLTLNSDHRKKMAIDLNFFFNGELSYDKSAIQLVADYWKNLSPQNYWGGDFKSLPDTNHFGRKQIMKGGTYNV